MKLKTAQKINKKTFPTLEKLGIIDVKGKENLPDNGKLTVFYGDHKHYLDPVVVISTIQYHTKDDSPIVAPVYPGYMGFEPNPEINFPRIVVDFGDKYNDFLASLGGVPLFNKKDYNAQLAKESFEEMQLLFERWGRLIIFPEGKLQREGKHNKYKTGLGRLVENIKDTVYFIPFELNYKPFKATVEFGKKFVVEDQLDKYTKTDKLEEKIFGLKYQEIC